MTMLITKGGANEGLPVGLCLCLSCRWIGCCWSLSSLCVVVVVVDVYPLSAFFMCQVNPTRDGQWL